MKKAIVDRPSELRSKIMASIRARGNRSTELCLIGMLRRSKLSGWRRHVELPGTPDFAFRHARVAVFVDGCFWHGCPSCSRQPRANSSYWKEKIAGNRRRDRRVTRALRNRGWRVIRIWEHSLRLDQSRVLGRIRRALRAGLAESAGR